MMKTLKAQLDVIIFAEMKATKARRILSTQALANYQAERMADGRSHQRSERMADRRVQKSNFCTPRQSKSI